MNLQRKGMLLAIIGAVMWGIMGVFVRGLSSEGLSSYDISFVRCLLAGSVFFIIKLIKNPKILKIDLKGLIICLIYGVLAYASSFIFYSIAVERIPVAIATVLMFMSPIWVALLGVVIFREKLKIQTIVTIGFCILGAILVSNLTGTSGKNIDIIGIIAGLANGFGVALQIMIPRYFSDKYERDTMLVYGFLGSAISLSFLTNFSLMSTKIYSGDLKLIFNLFGVGILCTMVANVCFVKSTEYIDTTTSSILSALEVVVGAIVGIIIFNESMSYLQVLGAIIVVLASLGSTIFVYLENTLVILQRYLPQPLCNLIKLKDKDNV